MEGLMKKLIIATVLSILSLTAFAAEKGEMYAGPLLGYHFFDSDHDLDDSPEIGARFGYFFTESIALEAEADYSNPEYKDGDNENTTSLSLQGVKFFDVNEVFKPFVFLGAGGMFSKDDMASLVAGVGVRAVANENISFDLRLKDMLHSKDSRNDIIPSVALNFHFGKTPKAVEPVAVETPEPAQEEQPAPAAVEEKAAEKTEVRMDSDGDGVYDDEDKCPNTPAGQPVNSAGCTPDTDGDGVYDFEDQCPDTMKGVKVNPAGCFVSMTLEVHFKTESDDIEDKFLDELRDFADFMKNSPAISIEIQGHTDSRGEDAFNMDLSRKRAESVANFLAENYGVDRNRMTTAGYGETKPIAPNDTPDNRRKNRRIETVIK